MVKLLITTYLDAETVERLDRMAHSMCGSRAQALRFLAEQAIAANLDRLDLLRSRTLPRAGA